MGIFSSKNAQDVIEQLHASQKESHNDSTDEEMMPWMSTADHAATPSRPSERPQLNSIRNDRTSVHTPDRDHVPRTTQGRDITAGSPRHRETLVPSANDYNRPRMNSRYPELHHSQSQNARSRDRGNNLIESHPYQRERHASFTSPVRSSSSLNSHSPDDRHSKSMSNALAKAHAYSRYLQHQKEAQEALRMQHQQLIVNPGVRDTMMGMDVRRSSSQEPKPDAANSRTDLSYLVTPTPTTLGTGVAYNWRRSSHVNPAVIPQAVGNHSHLARPQPNMSSSPKGAPSPRGSLTPKPSATSSKSRDSPQSSRQTDYSPPLDLRVKEIPRKRALAELYGDDQPLDLSVKQQKKNSDESDDDVILVGVHNLQDRVPCSSGSSQATNYSQMPIPMAHHSSMAPSHPLVTPYHHPSVVTQHTPNMHNSISSRRTSDYKRLPNDQRAISGNSAVRSPYPSYQVQPQQVNNVPGQLSLSNSTKPQGIPLVWGFDNRSHRPDNKCISNPIVQNTNSECSAYVAGMSKPIMESSTSRSSLDNRAGQPEAYQGLYGQERHIQRIDKYKEMGNQELHANSDTKQFSTLVPASPWIPPKGFMEQRQPKPSSPNVRHKTSVAAASSAVVGCLPSDKVEKDGTDQGSSYASGDNRVVYLDKAPMPVRFSPPYIPCTISTARADTKNTASETLLLSQSKTGGQKNSTLTSDIPDVKNQQQSEKQTNMIAPFNKLYQHPKPEPNQLVPIHLPHDVIQSTVAEPIPLPQQHASQLVSVPIIKEENILPLKAEVDSSDKNPCPIENDGLNAPGQHSKDPVGANAPSGITSQNVVNNIDSESKLTVPPSPVLMAQPQPQSNPNMVSKTESKFVSAAHKMIPVANVHPIVKTTSDMFPKLEVTKLCDGSAQDNEKEGTTILDSKQNELLKPSADVQQTIQITPNPLFSSHQDEFVRFLSRSNADPLPQFPRFSKKQLNLLAKTGLNKMENELYRDSEGDILPPDIQGKIAAELQEMERVHKNLALHFTTPKGRHKLLAKHSADSKDGILSNAKEHISGDLVSKPAIVTPEIIKSSEIQSKDTELSNKPKFRRKRRVKKEGDESVGSDRVPIKKRKKKLVCLVEEKTTSDKVEGDDKYILNKPEAPIITDSNAELVVPKRKRLGDKQLNTSHAEVLPEKKRRRRIKNARVPTNTLDDAGHKMRRKEHGRSKSSRTRTGKSALRKKSKQTSIYDKNAAYEAELRKEEERRLIRRVKREERFQVSVPLTRVDANDMTVTLVDVTANSNVDMPLVDLSDVMNDTGEVPEDGTELASPHREKCPRLKKSKKLSFKKKLTSKKRLLSGPICYTTGVSVELEPLHTPRKIKPKRLPMMKVTRRRVKREARDVTKCGGDSGDKKRLFVCRETGETTLHKAARKGYVEVALQCLDYGALNVNVRDNAGYTPLHESCVSGNLVIAKAMIARGADANVKALDGTRPLHDAVDNNHVELVRLLLSHGADPTIANYGGRTPLKLARSTNMKAFVTDHLADLRDEGPDWESPAFVGKQGHELGFDLLDCAPSGDDDDVSADVFVDLSTGEQPPVFYLNIEKKSGPRNYHIVNDVCQHLGQGSLEDFVLLNSDLHFSDYSKVEIIKQMRSNLICTVDVAKLEKLEDPVKLVEIDNALCHLLEINREQLFTAVSRQKDVGDSGRLTHHGVDATDAGPSGLHTSTGVSSGDANVACTSDIRKSKSCTSLDYCGLGLSGLSGLQLSGLNRCESSPDVKRPTLGYKKGNPSQVKTSTKLVKPEDCKAKHSAKIVSDAECATVKIVVPKEVTQAVLSNDVNSTVTALVREVTRKALTREVNKIAIDRMRQITVNTAAWNAAELPNSTTVTEVHKRTLPSEQSTVPITKGNKMIPQNSETATKSSHLPVDSHIDLSDGSENVSLNMSIIQMPEGVYNSVYDSDTEVESADDEIVFKSAKKNEEVNVKVSGLHHETQSQAASKSHSKVHATSEPRKLSSKSHSGNSSAQEHSVAVNNELTLPVLESTFDENKRVPDVASEEACLEEEREMPELTPCTY